jgi:GTP-binding protein HflX
VLVDHDISPSQARNLEKATGAEVMDRTAVILEIFRRHARSRVAKAQVEIVRLQYMAPRMRETGAGKDRQRGGIGGKGAGESGLELDRRKIRDRIAELTGELASLAEEQATQRARRRDMNRVALVGYTNAGKSTLMRALTGSEVYVADKLFATLDTTVRTLVPESHPRILVSDTVGFIDKLPHGLVASFKSTLDEALEAGLLAHVVDASDPGFERQLEVTHEVLADIGASEIPRLIIFNKMDRVGDCRQRGRGHRADLRARWPDRS